MKRKDWMPPRHPGDVIGWQLCGVYALMAVLVCSWIFAIYAGIAIASTRAFGRDLDGRYAQSQNRDWFRNQISPKTGGNCCSEADGVYAEEDVRNGEYWARFVAKQWNGAAYVEYEVDWMQVPGDVVINDPNRNGQPVVWFYWDAGWKIRCYAPGGKA